MKNRYLTFIKITTIILFSVFLIGTILWFFNYKNTIEERELLLRLDDGLTVFADHKITYYFNSDWCKVLITNSARTSITIRERMPGEDCATSLTGEKGFSQFSSQDQKLFDLISSVFDNKEGSVVIKYDQSGTITKGDFRFFGFTSPTGYVYEPDYQTLPLDVPYEEQFERIEGNPDWYRHYQDPL